MSPDAINILAWMEERGIRQITNCRIGGRVQVELIDGARLGTGRTVTEALNNARQVDAVRAA